MPGISIIVPVYNVEEYIHECIDSILTQEYTDFELILVDDGSPDNCPQICDEYAEKDSRVKVIHQKNSGVSAARNTGIRISSGEYIWFVDSDDYIMKGALQEISLHLSENLDIFGFNRLPLKYYDTKIKDTSEITLFFSGNQIKELVKYAHGNNILPYPWRYVYKSSIIKDNGIFFNEEIWYSEDALFNIEMFSIIHSVKFIGRRLYFYRQRDDGVSKKVPPRFDYNHVKQLEDGISLRCEIYNKFQVTSNEFVKDMSEFIIKVLYCVILLTRVYGCIDKNKFAIFRRVSKTDMIKKAFKRFDINEIKSNSLDWWMLWAVKHRLYFIGHLICKYILYK